MVGKSLALVVMCYVSFSISAFCLVDTVAWCYSGTIWVVFAIGGCLCVGAISAALLLHSSLIVLSHNMSGRY